MGFNSAFKGLNNYWSFVNGSI